MGRTSMGAVRGAQREFLAQAANDTESSRARQKLIRGYLFGAQSFVPARPETGLTAIDEPKCGSISRPDTIGRAGGRR